MCVNTYVGHLILNDAGLGIPFTEYDDNKNGYIVFNSIHPFI